VQESCQRALLEIQALLESTVAQRYGCGAPFICGLIVTKDTYAERDADRPAVRAARIRLRDG
jgi:hypothetical protein